MSLNDAIDRVRAFKLGSLKTRASALEGELKDASKGTLGPLYSEHNVDPALLRSALELREAATQIDEIVHATGI